MAGVFTIPLNLRPFRGLRTEAIEKKRKKLEEEKDKLEKQKAQNQKTLDTHQGTAASSPKGAGEDGRQKETQFLSEDEGKEDEDKNNAGLLGVLMDVMYLDPACTYRVLSG